MYTLSRSFVVVMVLSLASTSYAAPGALEISHTCALHTGCFAGDTAGYPVTITSATPGSSFVLTSDLFIPDELTDGISITKDLVRIDLGGFAIRGTTSCSGVPLSCSPIGSGFGIVHGGGTAGVEIRNGSVIGAGSNCVSIHTGVIENVRAQQCGASGLVITGRGVIRASTAEYSQNDGIHVVRASVQNSGAAYNGLAGIDVSSGGSVVNSAANYNEGNGIEASHGSTIEDCSSSSNGGSGFRVTGSATLRGNGAFANDDHGIEVVLYASTVIGNTISNNGDGETTDHGIYCNGTSCNIQGNTIRDSDGYGIFANDATSGYSGNVTHSNTQGAVSGGTDLGGNLLN